ncbi:hypothetical protein Efla_000881 [Eimeria flavescens]
MQTSRWKHLSLSDRSSRGEAASWHTLRGPPSVLPARAAAAAEGHGSGTLHIPHLSVKRNQTDFSALVFLQLTRIRTPGGEGQGGTQGASLKAMRTTEAALTRCRCVGGAVWMAGVRTSQPWGSLRRLLRGVSILCLLLVAAPFTESGCCIPTASRRRGALGLPRRLPPCACIGNPLPTLRSLWQGLWGRSLAAAEAAASRVGAAARQRAGLATSSLLPGGGRGLTEKPTTARDGEGLGAAETLRPQPAAAAAGEGAAPEAAAPNTAAALAASSAAAAREVEEAALWFKHQKELWRAKTAAEIKKRLQAEAAAREAEQRQQEASKRLKRPRRLVFSPASLKQRGWLAARRVDPARPLPCMLYAAVPPGRLAVAPACSGGGSKGSSRRNGEDIPWVSFAGLARLHRADPLKAKRLWFGQQTADFSAFYESASLPVGRHAAAAAQALTRAVLRCIDPGPLIGSLSLAGLTASCCLAASLLGVASIVQALLVRFLLDHKPAIPCLLTAACCGSVFAVREKLSRFTVSFLLSSAVWSRYALWSPLLHAPPALAVLLLRLLLHGAQTAGAAATAACRRGLEELEAALLEASIQENFHFAPSEAHVDAASERPPASTS